MRESHHTQNIQIKYWISFVPAWLCQSLWGVVYTFKIIYWSIVRVIQYSNMMKMLFWENSDEQWEGDTLEQCVTQKIVCRESEMKHQ